jgi:hypothetical protein
MEHRFRFKQGDFELELSGARDYVEAQLAHWLPRLSELAGQAGQAVHAVPTGQDAPGGPSRPSQPPQPAQPAEQPGPAPADPFPRVSPDFRPRTTITIADFVAMKQAHAPEDLVTVAGYYLEKYRQMEAFAPQDLQGLLAGLPAWECRTLDEPLELVLAKGFVERLRDGRLTMTYKGQNYVRDGLSA